MKKLAFTIVLFISMLTSLKAQDIYYGPKVGANLTHFFYSGEDADYLKDMSKLKLASHFGVFAEIVFDDFFSVQPELLYSVKGARYRISDDDDFKSSYVLKYLSLPVVAKYYVTKEISLEAGPQVAYLLSAKNIETSDDLSSNLGEEAASIDIKNQMQSIDFGATAGVGYLTKTGFYISARYTFGILNAHKSLADENTIMHNGAVQVSFGFSFQ
jgi:hypothetical protein